MIRVCMYTLLFKNIHTLVENRQQFECMTRDGKFSVWMIRVLVEFMACGINTRIYEIKWSCWRGHFHWRKLGELERYSRQKNFFLLHFVKSWAISGTQPVFSIIIGTTVWKCLSGIKKKYWLEIWDEDFWFK